MFSLILHRQEWQSEMTTRNNWSSIYKKEEYVSIVMTMGLPYKVYDSKLINKWPLTYDYIKIKYF